MSIEGGWQLTRGVFVGRPQRHSDERGLFQELFRRSWAPAEALGVEVQQMSRTISRRGVLRGLHFTAVPPGQTKHVSCVSGRAFDVVVDVRVGSPTFGEHVGVTLDAVSGTVLTLADGMAHGYLALEDDTSIVYLHGAEYAPEHDHDLQALDPVLGIDWPIPVAVRSAKDTAAPSLAGCTALGVLPRFPDGTAP